MIIGDVIKKHLSCFLFSACSVEKDLEVGSVSMTAAGRRLEFLFIRKAADLTNLGRPECGFFMPFIQKKKLKKIRLHEHVQIILPASFLPLNLLKFFFRIIELV